MSNMDEKVNFHREVMLAELDAIGDFGSGRLTKEEMYEIAKNIYERTYKELIPYDEVEKYKP